MTSAIKPRNPRPNGTEFTSIGARGGDHNSSVPDLYALSAHDLDTPTSVEDFRIRLRDKVV